MPTIKFTHALKRFYPQLAPIEIKADHVEALIQVLEEHHPGLKSYLLDDQGSLRKHVNVFVDGQMIKDRDQLSDSLLEVDEVYIMQALSGG